MKSLYVFLLVCFTHCSGLSQNCFPDGLILFNQTDVDSFPLKYPDCRVIEGPLTIFRFSNINSLLPLRQLRRLEQGLLIQDQLLLENLEGLDSLEEIRGSIKFDGTALRDISALQNCELNRAHLVIGDCALLESLNGLEQVDTLIGLRLNSLPRVQDLTPLANLRFTEAELMIENCDGLTSLDGLSQVQLVQDELRIQFNDQLLNINALNSLAQVKGDLLILENPLLASLQGLNQVDSVGGDLIIWLSDQLVDLSGLEQLRFVGDLLSIKENPQLLSLAGLERLQTVRGNLEIRDNRRLEQISDLIHLDTIGVLLRVENNRRLKRLTGLDSVQFLGADCTIRLQDSLFHLNGLEFLDTVRGELDISDNYFLRDLSGLDSLKSVQGRLVISRNNRLESLQALSQLKWAGALLVNFNIQLDSLTGLEGLDSIPGTTNIIGNRTLDNLRGLKNLRYVGDRLRIHNSEALVDLQGLNQLYKVEKDFEIHFNDSLRSLAGLENLRILNNNFQIRQNSRLENLAGLQQLDTLAKSLIVTENRRLKSLDGFPPTYLHEGEVYITQNDSLRNISGFNQLDLSNSSILWIRQNPQLKVCNESFVCNYILNGFGAIDISENDTACSVLQEIIAGCEDFHPVFFQAFYDINQNGEQESGEPLLSNIRFQIQPSDVQFTTNVNNFNRYFATPGSYQANWLASENPNWQLTTDSTIYAFTLSPSGSEDSLLYGLFPDSLISAMTATIAFPRARCGTFQTFRVASHNIGNTITEGVLWLKIDPAITDTSYIQAPDTIVGQDRIGWFFSDLFPGESVTRDIRLRIPLPGNFPVGGQLAFSSFANFTDSNGAQVSPIFSDQTTLRCSYDPNDKLVQPSRNNQYTLFGEALTYTVRFQNTGNDVAFDVLIRDTLDEHLDLTTLQILESSHAEVLNTTLGEERELVFSFKNIFLPDSTTDLQRSQGYVTYLIRPFAGLAEQTTIKNTASIFFDFNPPIITNTTENVLVSMLPTSTQELEPDPLFTFFPNPTTGYLKVETQQALSGTLRLWDLWGQIKFQQTLQESQEIDLRTLPAGVYWLSIISDRGQVTRKIVKQ